MISVMHGQMLKIKSVVATNKDVHFLAPQV